MFPKYGVLILSDKHCWSLPATSTLHMCVWGLHRCNKQANTKWQLITVRLTLTCYSSPKRWSNTQFSSCSTWKVSRFLDGGRQTLPFRSYLHWISLRPFWFLGTNNKAVTEAVKQVDNVKTWKHTIMEVNEAIKIILECVSHDSICHISSGTHMKLY